MADGYRSRGFHQRISQNADNVEYAAMKHATAVVGTGLLEAEISGALDDFVHERDEAVHEDWQRRDLEIESGISHIQAELARRATLLGSAYPFTITDAGISYAGRTANSLYEFCLAISCAPNLTTGDYVRLPRTFERVVAIVAEMLLGEGAQSLHIGAPRDASVGTSFRDAMVKLHSMAQEFHWDPEEEYLANDPATNGDEGVDFVAWKAPGDVRPGRIFVLGQCACGNTIEDKYGDVNLKKFQKWFRPGPALEPIRAFATPRHVPDIGLREAQREAGLVLDRARLTLIANGGAGSAKLAEYAVEMNELIDLVVVAA